jgi:hypothetical protein
VSSPLTQIECEALVTINAANGNRLGTPDAEPCQHWYGLTCEGSHVTRIVAPSHWRLNLGPQLTTLPPEIGNLTKLITLSLSDHQLVGDITPRASPLRRDASLYSLGLAANGCLSTTAPDVDAWLTSWIRSGSRGAHPQAFACDPPHPQGADHNSF